MPERDTEAIAEASNYVRHGTNGWGGSFPECICPKEPCGGVAHEQGDCPEHRRAPAQLWHWAAECPGA